MPEMLGMRQYLTELGMWKEALDDSIPDPFFKTSITDISYVDKCNNTLCNFYF